MSDSTATRLARIRGAARPRPHDARAIAALTRNPGCSRRAVLDAAGVDKGGLAERIGFPARYGQSPFSITRGNLFEALVKGDERGELLRLLRETRGLDLAAGDCQLFDHPPLRLSVGGARVRLEPDLVAVDAKGVHHIIEIKSFAVIDDQADGDKVAAAATQAAVYVLALREMLREGDHLGDDSPASDRSVSHEVVLVCPRNFSSRPTGTVLDVRRQILAIEHRLRRLADVGTLLAGLPPDLTFDLRTDDSDRPTRAADELIAAIAQLSARYYPTCLEHCDLAFFCRDEARDSTAALGVAVREELCGVETVSEVLDLAVGSVSPKEDQAEAAEMLRLAASFYREATE